MKSILVTGGGGFIGSNLVEGLCARGRRVVVCDRFGDNEKWANLVGMPVWDIIGIDSLHAWLEENGKEVEAVFHCGGISSTTEQNAELLIEHNTRMPLALMRTCAGHGIRLIYLSSYATYGAGELGFDDDPALESLLRLRPLSAHGWSKHMFDLMMAQRVASGAPMPPQWVGLKLFNVYGPREAHKDAQRSVIGKMIEQARMAGTVQLFRSQNPAYADGAQMRDVIYVRDCVDVMLWLLDNPRINGLFNLGSGKASTFKEMVEAVFKALGREPRVHYFEMPDNVARSYQYFTEAHMERLRAAGYAAPFTTLAEGVRDYVRCYTH